MPLSVIHMKAQGVGVILSSNNGFTLPTNLDRICDDITELALANCSLAGSIPKGIGGLHYLSSLNLAGNTLNGLCDNRDGGRVGGGLCSRGAIMCLWRGGYRF